MKVPIRVLKLVGAAAKDPGRYAIRSVYLEREKGGRPWAVATDGRIMVAHTWEKAESMSQGVPAKVTGYALDRDSVEKIAKVARSEKETEVEVEEGAPDGTTMVMIGKTRLAASVEAGIYPTWRQVVPTWKPTLAMTFNARRLAQLALTMAEVSGMEEITLEFEGNPERPARVISHDGATVGVICPLTRDGKVRSVRVREQGQEGEPEEEQPVEEKREEEQVPAQKPEPEIAAEEIAADPKVQEEVNQVLEELEQKDGAVEAVGKNGTGEDSADDAILEQLKEVVGEQQKLLKRLDVIELRNDRMDRIRSGQ